MARAAKKPEFPKTVAFENGRVRVALRGNGMFALAWRENGGVKKTTFSTKEKAMTFAEGKARELNAGTNRKWITPLESDQLDTLARLAGTGEGAVRALLEDVEGARKWLDGLADLTTAARYYAEHGPLKIQKARLESTVKRFLDEYHGDNLRTFRKDLHALRDAHPHAMMLDLTEDLLKGFAWRKVTDRRGGGKALVSPAPRTVLNRITTLVTFMNRARDWKLLPPGKHAADLLRRPVIPDEGKAIFTVGQARNLLALVRQHAPKLEPFLLIAGWLGLRPSECQRLTWKGLDFQRGYLHVDVRVGGKNSAERYVPIDPRVASRLRVLFEATPNTGKAKLNAKACLYHSRDELSELARKHGVIEHWEPDVLRHSFCSYRLALTQDIARVAEEAGNSPAIIKKNYRKPVFPEEAVAWWDLLNPAKGCLPNSPSLP
jgi:integrase